MNFTKQDIQKLAQMLSRLSVKDSQFVKANTLSAEARVPVLDDGVNKTASARLMAKWVAKNINLGEVPVNINGAESDDLLNLLAELVAKSGVYVTPEGQWLVAETLKCNKEFEGTLYTNFSDLLDQLIAYIEKHETFINEWSINMATSLDIVEIFNNQNQTNQ